MLLNGLWQHNRSFPSWNYDEVLPTIFNQHLVSPELLKLKVARKSKPPCGIEVKPLMYASQSKNNHEITLPQKAAKALATD